jgi:5-methylcytosine-specific restriction enzyme subunit McrC
MCPMINVFEHDTLCVGAVASGSVSAPTLTQIQFDALARFNDAHGQRYFRLGHRRLKLGSFVGYLQIGKLGIQILPKVDRDAPRTDDSARWQDFLLEMLRVSTGIPLHSPTDALRQAGRPTLFELVVLRFISEVEGLLHDGLAKGYREIEGNGHTLRGRLLGAAHVRSNFARSDRFYIAYSAFEHDIPINCFLAAALRIVAAQSLPAALHARVARCALLFPEVSTTGVQAEHYDRITQTRSTVRYRVAVNLARMILEQRAPELKSGRQDVFAILFDMNALWERYVGWLFQRAAPKHWEIVLQESRAFWRAGALTARRVRPDLIVRDRAKRTHVLIADAKWKALRDSEPVDEHLKQMFVYNKLFDAPQSVLVHPTASRGHCRINGTYLDRVQRLKPQTADACDLDRGHGCSVLEIALCDGVRPHADAMVEQVRTMLAGVPQRQ